MPLHHQLYFFSFLVLFSFEIAQTWSIYTIPDSGLEAPSTGHGRIRQIGATDAAWRHGARYRYLGRDDDPRCPSRSKAKVNCFLHALPTATCGYVGNPKGGGIPPEQNTAALNDGAKVRYFFDNGDP